MTKFSKLDEDLVKFGIGNKTKLIVQQRFAGNPEEKKTNKEEGAGDPLLQFCKKARDAAIEELRLCMQGDKKDADLKQLKATNDAITKATQTSNRLIETMYNQFDNAKKSYQAAKDMNCYFM